MHAEYYAIVSYCKEIKQGWYKFFPYQLNESRRHSFQGRSIPSPQPISRDKSQAATIDSRDRALAEPIFRNICPIIKIRASNVTRDDITMIKVICCIYQLNGSRRHSFRDRSVRVRRVLQMKAELIWRRRIVSRAANFMRQKWRGRATHSVPNFAKMHFPYFE